MSDSDKQTVSPIGDGKYLLLVGGILMTIVLTLAVLWQMERRRRIATQTELAECVGKLNRANMQSGLSQSVLSRMTGAIESVRINRQELPPQQVELNGKPRKIFRISASAGEKIGFLPGDLVEIDDPLPTPPPDEQ